MTRHVRYFSAFSGIGSFELACRLVSEELPPKAITFSCIGYSEIDRYAIEIYQRHFAHRNYGDITCLTADALPDFDLFVGGFPCQAFSMAGKRQGFGDPRGTLFFEAARLIRKKQPRLLLLENVKGLLSHDQGRTFAAIIATLDELGYDCQWQVLNSKDFGVPQNRERIFIIGHRRSTPRPQVFPLGKAAASYIEEKPFAAAVCTPERKRLRQHYGRWMKQNGEPSFTLTANDRHGFYDGRNIRRFTPLECERLQGFPDGWTADLSDYQRYKCLGNTITVNVLYAILGKLITSEQKFGSHFLRPTS